MLEGFNHVSEGDEEVMILFHQFLLVFLVGIGPLIHVERLDGKFLGKVVSETGVEPVLGKTLEFESAGAAQSVRGDVLGVLVLDGAVEDLDRKSTRLNSSHRT